MSSPKDDPARTVGILVVEDDPAVRDLIGTILKDVDGWTATVARTGASMAGMAPVPFRPDAAVEAARVQHGAAVDASNDKTPDDASGVPRRRPNLP